MGEELREKIRERYAGTARTVRGETGSGGSCCGPSCCVPDSQALESEEGGTSCCSSSCCGSGPGALLVDMTGDSYSEAEKRELPQLAADASLGCGNPVALATLAPGEAVLDLGSGGGIDVLLSARRVAPGGKAYGLDMIDDMLDLARENREKAGVENAEFLKGEIEDVPLPDGYVELVISNCVINLSTDKERVIAEAFRVLKPGGRFAVSDVVFLGEKGSLPAGVARSVELWSGCVSGALDKSEYEDLLAAVGFEDVSVEVTHTYPPELVEGLGSPEEVEALREMPVTSAFVRARKMDNLSAHKGGRVKEIIEGRGCELVYLPPYSPDFNPIEQAFSKVKGLLRRTEARTRESLTDAMGRALDAIMAQDARGFFRHCGYRRVSQLL